MSEPGYAVVWDGVRERRGVCPSLLGLHPETRRPAPPVPDDQRRAPRQPRRLPMTLGELKRRDGLTNAARRATSAEVDE